MQATSDLPGWIVVGAARDEAAFWAGVAEDRDPTNNVIALDGGLYPA